MAPSRPIVVVPTFVLLLSAALVASSLAPPRGARAAPATKLHDTSLSVDPELTAGTWATVFVAVHAAADLFSQEPVADASVQASFVDANGGAESAPVTTTTAPDGSAIVRLQAPAAGGAYDLVIETRSVHGSDRVVRRVIVVERRALVLRTDRTQYQPGQTIRWRTTLLNGLDAHPVAGEALTVELHDARGTLLWRESARTDRHGMAVGAVPMAETTLGTLSLSARAGTSAAKEAITVKRVALPRMLITFERVIVTPGQDMAPGSVSGVVLARYPYGEPVRGQVSVNGARASGELDAQGRFAFTLPVPVGGGLQLEAQVIDGTGRAEHGRHQITLSEPRLALAVVPSRRVVRPHQPVELTVLTTDGNGAFMPAQLTFMATHGHLDKVVAGPPGAPLRDGVASSGALRISGSADAQGLFDVSVTAAANGRTVVEGVRLRRDSRTNAPALTLTDVLAEAGPIAVGGSWPDARGPVLVTLLRNGTPLAATSAFVRDGRLSATLEAPAGVFGLCTVRASELRWERSGEVSVIHDERHIYLAPATLAVSIAGEVRHAPGQTPTLALTVKDASGQPLPGVGIAASVIDERALALSRKRIDLVSLLRGLDLSVGRDLKPLAGQGEDLGLAFARLLTTHTPEAQIAAYAVIESLRAEERVPQFEIEGATRLDAERKRLRKALVAVTKALDASPLPAFVRPAPGAGWAFRAELAVVLAQAGWPSSDRMTPWAAATTWDYGAALVPELTPLQLGPTLATLRLEALASAIVATQKAARRSRFLRDPDGALPALLVDGAIAAGLGHDPWGQPILVELERVRDEGRGRTIRVIKLRSLGPDGVAKSGDDLVREDVFRDYRGDNGWGLGFTGDGSGGGGFGVGRDYCGIDSLPGVRELPLAAVRRRFDETVLWTIGVTTDRQGEALVEVPLADSITGWEMLVEAISPGGAVGVAKTRLETFLPLHVEAAPPERLVVGDRYGLSVVVANHSGKDAELGIIASASDGLTIDGPNPPDPGDPAQRIRLADGATAAVTVPLIAVAAGTGRYRVTLVDHAGTTDEPRSVDALEREVLIEPIGALVTSSIARREKDGDLRFEIEVPASTAPGSAGARLQVYRDLVDLSIDGLEGMIREPHGCFEQTSSSTHPNVLVLELLGRHPRHEAARAKARDYIARGYQRLVSFEVAGEPGGFSLFGDAPASRTLTAYGLVEFSDMARVFPIDPGLIARTRDWVLAQQRPDGSWQPDSGHHGDLAPAQTFATTAFVAWALAESGHGGKALDKAFGWLERHRASADPYGVALWASAEAKQQRPPIARVMLASYRELDDGLPTWGSADPDYESLMHARGRGVSVQMTALAATAQLRSGAPGEAQRALDWLWAARTGGGWGTTHDTMLALRAAAIVHDRPRDAPLPDRLGVVIDGKPAGVLRLGEQHGVPGLDLAALTPGAHVITLASPPAGLRADLRLSWRTATAPDAVASGLVVRLGGATQTLVDEPLAQHVVLANPGTTPVAMPTLVIPVPAGFRADPDALRSLAQRPEVASVDDVGAAIHVYLRTIAAATELTFDYALIATAVCQVTQRPASAFAYYDPTTRGSSASRRLSAGPRP